MTTTHKYIIGYGLSIILTVAAFGLVGEHINSGHTYPSHEFIYATLILLAIVQLLVQLIAFLHVGEESKPKWNFMALILTLFIVIVVVGGSLWIMRNLMYGQQMLQPYIHNVISPQTEND
jgi:cytochrome o ubiquinol oxidase operon protein cyoD